MILINNEEINLGTALEHTEIEEVIMQKQEVIKKTFAGRFPLKFTLEDRYISKTKTTDATFQNTREILVYPSRPISLHSQVVIDNERVEIRYCKSRKFNENKQTFINSPKNLVFKTTYDVNQFDIDLAFFLLYCHPNISGNLEGDDIKIVRRAAPEYFYKFIDLYKNATEIIEKDKHETTTKYMIYNALTNEEIKSMAILYNIPNANMKTNDESDTLRVELFDKIKELARKAASYENTHELFKSKCDELVKGKTNKPKDDKKPPVDPNGETGIDRDLRIKAFITDSMDTDAISAQGLNSAQADKKRWILRNVDNNKMSVEICRITHEDPLESLYTHMIQSEQIEKETIELITNRIAEREAVMQKIT